MDCGYEVELEHPEKETLLSDNALDKLFMKKLLALLSSRTLRILVVVYEIINRLILILGFMGLTTGVVTYGGIFVSHTSISRNK
jgi:hypothetical protein